MQLSIILGLALVQVPVYPFSPRLPRPDIHGSMLSKKDLIPRYSRRTRATIAAQHNFHRANVDPSAADMQEMTWYRWAARTAQKWAEKCRLLVHTGLEELTDPVMGQCGQNIFVASTEVPWSFAVRVWDLEKYNFSYGGIRNNTAGLNGHYTQLVWATSRKVGCGYARCEMKDKNRTRTFHNYVCNYCPIGNHPNIRDWPYRAGQPCSYCLGSCRNNLCHGIG
ncbi:cysteine-rich secretory protein 3-like [Galendromus occidentalis]|uniref:Cysteine-rich secretory protein 3-like n=1 Tax=Galendromus occidentalis TaxID=34638 RepID=A0AAJ7L4V7_9ACAR|nr:cysteine-rich secretory protein 3-like [Galendromus occidentalis]